jgi:hypothetical protein
VPQVHNTCPHISKLSTETNVSQYTSHLSGSIKCPGVGTALEHMLRFLHGFGAKGLRFSIMAMMKRYLSTSSAWQLPPAITAWLFGVRAKG